MAFGFGFVLFGVFFLVGLGFWGFVLLLLLVGWFLSTEAQKEAGRTRDQE